MQINNIKVVFIDIDNTLVARKSKFGVSSENIEALKKLQLNDIYPVLITGRTPEDTIKIWEQFRINKYGDYIITSNGALVENLIEKKILYNQAIPKEDAKEIVQYCKKNNYFVKLSNHPNLRRTGKRTTRERILNSYFHFPIKDFNSIDQVKYENNNKIGIFAYMNSKKNFAIIEELAKEFPNLEFITSSNDRYIEITAKGISKSAGAAELLKFLNINSKDTIAIGDSMNDYNLFNYVGKSVAVKNASKKLKSVADFTSKTAAKNGVAYTINTMILSDKA